MRHRRMLTALACACWALCASAGDPVPPEFRGDWVPKSAGCKSALRFRAYVDTVELVNGADRESYGDLAWPTSYFGPDYTGIVVVGIPKFESDQPFTIYFNADEKKGTAKLLIVQGKEVKGNETLNALVRAARKLDTRFPLDNVELKKCGAPR